MVDTLIYGLGALAGVVFLIATFYIGRLFDIEFRCRQMRNFLKKNYIVINKVQKNRLTIIKIIINADSDVVFDSNRLWASVQGKLYNTTVRDNLPIKSLINEALNQSEPIDIETKLIWQSGTPCLYVDNDSSIPLTFHAQEAQVKPDEVGAGINAWNAVQKAKLLAQFDQKQLFTWIIIILCIGSVGFGFVNYGILDAMQTTQKAQGAQLDRLIPPSMNVTNGTIVINQGVNNGR
jgi:hypothetical protein